MEVNTQQLPTPRLISQPRDDPPDPDVRFRRGQLADAARVEDFHLLGEAFHRVAAHVKAERFLLEGQLLRLGPRMSARAASTFFELADTPAENTVTR